MNTNMNSMTQAENRPQRENEQKNRGYIVPEVNIIETKDGYELDAEMPGVTKEGLEILLEGNELVLTGHRRQEDQPGELIYRESTGNDYRRTFVLDPTVDTTKIEARMDHGILKLRLPKAERVKPRKIQISG